MKKPKFLDEAFTEVNEELLETFIKKHKDYGKGNILDTGELGILFRINDKVNRLKNLLTTGQKPENESVEETWRDIAVYAVIAILYERDWFQKLEMKNKKKEIEK